MTYLEKLLEAVEEAISRLRDDLAQLLELLLQRGVDPRPVLAALAALATPRPAPTPASAPAPAPRRPPPSAAHIAQAAAGVSSVRVKWDGHRAKVHIDGLEIELPLMLGLVFEGLCTEDGEEDQTAFRPWKSTADIAAYIGSRYAVARGRKLHRITQNISRLRKRLPNPLLIRRRGRSAYYRLAIRREASFLPEGSPGRKVANPREVSKA